MVRNFFSTANVMGRLMIVLLFVGGVVFAGAFDGFVVETEASSCCGGGTSMDIFSSSSNNNGDDDPEDPEDPEDNVCGCCDDCTENDSCPDGQEAGCGGMISTPGCLTSCPQNEDDGCYCTVETLCGDVADLCRGTKCTP